MSLEEFSCVVLGDEPAGLWLLGRYAAELEEQGITGRFAYVSLGRPAAKTCFPAALAKEFGVTLTETEIWSAEIISPEASLVWRTADIAAQFPEMPKRLLEDGNVGALLTPSPSELGAVNQALRLHPELLSYAEAIWKRVGRTHHLSADKTVLGALMCRQLAWWDAEKCLPEATKRFVVDPRQSPVESVKSARNGALTITFKDQPAIVSRKWIVNTSFQILELLSLRCPDLMKIVGITDEHRSRNAIFPMTLKVEPESVPAPVRPVTIYCDTNAIPDFESELWPIDFNRQSKSDPASSEITLWVCAPRAISLERVLDGFRDGLRRLNRLFPFLRGKINEMPFALDMESCFASPDRIAALDALELAAVENFELTSFSTETRNSSVFALLPHLNCYLPYPVGPLRAAQKLLPRMVGKKKKKPEPVAAKDISAN